VAGGQVFVCYGRDDSAGESGRLYDRLNSRFPGRVFMDVAGISAGTRWAEVIDRTLRSCEVAVVLIGRRWLEATHTGERRLDRTDDPIHGELAAALRLGLTVVPVLVGGASMPERAELPPPLAALADWQARRIDHDDFDHDASRLIREIERVLDEPASPDPGRDEGQSPTDSGPIRLHGSDARRERVGWLGHRLGSFKVWVSVGVAAMAFFVVGSGQLFDFSAPTAIEPGPLDSSANPSPTPGRAGETRTTDARPTPPDPAPAPRTPAPAPRTATPSLAGTYVLASYTFNGVPLSAAGMMRLTDVQPGAYQFQTQVTDPTSDSELFYTGMLQSQGSSWFNDDRQHERSNCGVHAHPDRARVRRVDPSNAQRVRAGGRLAQAPVAPRLATRMRRATLRSSLSRVAENHLAIELRGARASQHEVMLRKFLSTRRCRASGAEPRPSGGRQPPTLQLTRGHPRHP
jgi:hypothetical protein